MDPNEPFNPDGSTLAGQGSDATGNDQTTNPNLVPEQDGATDANSVSNATHAADAPVNSTDEQSQANA